jgi:hypothetical protein
MVRMLTTSRGLSDRASGSGFQRAPALHQDPEAAAWKPKPLACTIGDLQDAYDRSYPRIRVTPGFKAKTRFSSYVYPGSSCHTYDQNVNTENQCLYYIVSYYKSYYKSRKE